MKLSKYFHNLQARRKMLSNKLAKANIGGGAAGGNVEFTTPGW